MKSNFNNDTRIDSMSLKTAMEDLRFQEPHVHCITSKMKQERRYKYISYFRRFDIYINSVEAFGIEPPNHYSPLLLRGMIAIIRDSATTVT